MRLVSIESAEEQSALQQVVPSTDYEAWWTSGSDEESEGHWTWTATGQPFHYTNWGRKQPNGGTGENRLMLTRFDLHWHDWDGHYGYEYSICEAQ